jgi:N-acetylglucosaminyldiphosphoundecaprenol N-acetyl-beta-D-mannosaminyltransferase
MTNPSQRYNSFSDGIEIPVVNVGGLPLAVIDRARSAELMVELAIERRQTGLPPIYVTSANGQVLSLCARDPHVRSLFLSADLIHADGTPLVFASRLRSRTPLPERVATTDLFHDVARVAQKRGGTFFLLGASRDMMQMAIIKVRQQYRDLQIVGFRHGYFGEDETDDVISQINSARPDILWIGMGVPLEQRFALRHRGRLTNVGIIKTSGGLFDFLSERNSRAPFWMQSAGLEWLYRLALEPRRLFFRYLTTNPHALYLLLTGGPQALERAGTTASHGGMP